jgi:hypothetical protein
VVFTFKITQQSLLKIDILLSGEFHSGPPSGAKVKESVDIYLHSPNTPSWRGA